MTKDQIVNVCNAVIADVESDAARFDGQPFDGRTVAEYLGNHGAAIAALANLIKELCIK